VRIAFNLRERCDYLGVMSSRLHVLHPWLMLSGAVLLLAACGGSKPTPTPSPSPATEVAPRDSTPSPSVAPSVVPPRPPPPVFGDYASRMVVVFPLQRFAVGDSGWLTAASATGRLRAALLDSALTAVLRDRGLETTWSLPPNTSRVAQREVINRTDPRALSTAGLVPSKRRNDIDLREPLGSQLRAIIALVPESRLILLPLEVRVLNTPAGQRQATLRIAFLDGRMSTVLSFPDVIGPPSADEKTAVQAVASKFADLVIVP
jgi:hypothetical protein